ncbi:MAG: hypothetical protein WCS89_00335 [Candidatus Paceibacterota bacterium]
MKKIQYFVTGLAISLPFIASAQTQMKLSDLMAKLAGYLNQALALLMGFAVVVFVFYVIKYFIQPGDTKRVEAAQYLMWSLIGFFVILSLWGLVNILISTFDLGTSSPGSWASLRNLFPN